MPNLITDALLNLIQQADVAYHAVRVSGPPVPQGWEEATQAFSALDSVRHGRRTALEAAAIAWEKAQTAATKNPAWATFKNNVEAVALEVLRP